MPEIVTLASSSPNRAYKSGIYLKRTLWRHTTTQAVQEGVWFHANFFCPHRNRLRLASMSNCGVGAYVVCLLLCRGPPAVARLGVAFAIDAFDRRPWRRVAHIFQEAFEILPALADPNAFIEIESSAFPVGSF